MGKDAIRSFIPDRAVFRPAAINVSEGEAPDKVAGQRITTMGDGISLKEARPGNIPGVGFNGDLVFEQCSGFGAAESFGFIGNPNGPEGTVNGRGADSEQFCFYGSIKGTILLFIERQPQGESSLQFFRTHLVSCKPDTL